MPELDINLDTQIASEITRADLLALIAASGVERKQYYITDAINNTRRISVFYRSPTQVSTAAFVLNNGQHGLYFLVPDLFVPLTSGVGAVVTGASLSSFFVPGELSTVYIALDTGQGYTWNGSAYVTLSPTVFAANFGALPVTGTVNTLYITNDNGNSYLWDGSAYVQTSNGTPQDFVESVTGDSVDNTDPFNPVVNAIPLSGTTPGNPVTGQIETDDVFVLFNGVLSAQHVMLYMESFQLVLRYENALGQYTDITLNGSEEIGVGSSIPNFRGFGYASDFSANFTLNSLINLAVLKSRIWTKSGIPTTTDDGTQGFVVGSLLWDTTNSILYRCTANTTGAATWVLAITPPNYLEVIRAGAAVPSPSGTTRFMSEGFSGLSTTLITTICPQKRFTTFRVFISSAQPGTGTLVVRRIFYNVAGTVQATQELVIPSASPAGIYTFTGTPFDATSLVGSYSFTLVNNAAANSGTVNSIESVYE